MVMRWIKKNVIGEVAEDPVKAAVARIRVMPEDHDTSGLQYRPTQVSERQTDTLIGLAKGLIADGAVDQGEAEFLLNWLANNRFTESPMIDALLDSVRVMLTDDHLDEQEHKDLYQLLAAFAGNPVTMGELLQSTYLPLD